MCLRYSTLNNYNNFEDRILARELLMKHLFLSLCAALMFTGSLQADIISFSDLDQDFDASNTLNVGGSTAGFTITGSDSSGVLTYNVSYMADFGTGTGVETLSFDVVVQGFENVSDSIYVGDGNNAGNMVNFGAGSTLVDVNPNAANQTWRVNTGNNANDAARFDRDETLVFDLVNLSITGANSADFLGFDAVRFQESGGNQHQALVGIGSGVLGDQFNNNPADLTIPLAQTLYASGDANDNGTGLNFGVNNVGFDIHVKAAQAVPEPSSAMFLFSVCALSICGRRRSS